MAYQKQTWRDYDDNKTEVVNMNQGAVVTPERLNHMETGIANSADKATLQQLEVSVTQQLQQTNRLVKNIGVDVTRFGAKGDGVSDDSQAIKKAIDYAVSYAKEESKNGGWKSYIPTIFFPSGRYVVSEKGTLNPTEGALMGYNIKGAGYLSTEILYTYVPLEGEEDDYLLLNGNENWFGFSYIEDLTVKGNKNNKFWGIKSREGSPQANRFSRVRFVNLKEAVTVDFGTANANADLFRFESCKANNISGWVFGVKTNKNSQSIAHTFRDCDFENISGKILYFRSGGTVEIRGGSWIVNKTGRIIHTEDTSMSGIGSTNNFFTFYGTKFEWQHYDKKDTASDRYPLVYNKSMAKITFNHCNFGQFSFSPEGSDSYDYALVSDLGNLVFNDCFLPYVMDIKVSVPNNVSLSPHRPRIEFRNSRVEKQIDDIVNVVFIGGGNNTGLYPSIIADGCVWKSNHPVDVTLYKQYGARHQASTKKIYTFSQGVSTMVGLPTPTSDGGEKIVSYTLPMGAIVSKIRVVFLPSQDGTTRNIKVTNHDGSKVFITGSNMPLSGFRSVVSEELYEIVDTVEKQQLRVIGSANFGHSAGGTSGYIEVEYS